MKCPKTWCPLRHSACERFRKDDTMFSCHKPENEPFMEKVIDID